jgi:hypothetical protein
MTRTVVGLLFVVALNGALGACYLPARFAAEVDVARTGFYSIDFVGYLAWVPLYEKLHNNEISPSEERKEVKRILTDLRRDDAVKEAEYYKKGHFKVVYRKTGDLLKTGMVTFIRRNEDMLTLTYSRRDRQIRLRGRELNKTDVERLVDMGLWVEGELRLKTGAPVLSQNAKRVEKSADGRQTLVWTIKSPYDPTPEAVLALR